MGGGGGGGGGPPEVCVCCWVVEVTAEWRVEAAGVSSNLMDNGRFSSPIPGGGNCGVCVGVFGDESGADSGELSTSIGGGLPDVLRLAVAVEGGTEVAVVVDSAAIVEALTVDASTVESSLGTLETFDALLDLASDFDLDIREEFLELGRPSSKRSPSFTDAGVPDLLFADRSVSGGLGGLSSFRDSFRDSFRETEEVLRVEVGESADFDRFISLPARSVASGVYGSVRRAPELDRVRSSLLCKDTLL